MSKSLKSILEQELEQIKEDGFYKPERVLSSKQGREITIDGQQLLNFCSNNYLGLAGTAPLAKASEEALDRWGFGTASVRFICGTQEIHNQLEAQTADYLEFEDAVTYSSCYMANVGLFQTFFGPDDAIISDSLNHASIIDAIRLTKAERRIYQHMDMADLETQLKETSDKRLRVIATDGVFSMDGDLAPLEEICDLADEYDALVMVDDAHGTGVVGETGRGTHQAKNAMGRIDFLTGTYGKALGGAGGAFTATNKTIAEYLRQRSRTYLFSNALDTGIAGAALFVLDYVQSHPEIQQKLHENVDYFRTKLRAAGFEVSDAAHPITPIMLGKGELAGKMAQGLFEKGIFAVGFSYPVVPKGKARIRVQLSAAHTTADLDRAAKVFSEVGSKLSVI